LPLYEYQCPKCGRFEVIRKFSDPPLEACPTCGAAIQKMLSAPAIQFKGSGWYITDYARAGKSDPGAAGSGKSESSASSDSKSDSKGESQSKGKTESSSETKSESKPSPPSTS
jgi:putative FmdB family regulatory protein